MKGLFVENVVTVNGLSPAADLYNGNPATDVVNLKEHGKAVFMLAQKTAGTNTGTATVTVVAASSVAPSNTAAIVFKYKKKTTGASSVWGDLTAATTSGFVTTANEDTVYAIEVDAADLPDSKPYVYLKLTETVNDPVTGAVLIHLYNARYSNANDVLA